MKARASGSLHNVGLNLRSPCLGIAPASRPFEADIGPGPGVIEEDLCDRTEVRLVNLADRLARRIAYSFCGLSGSTLLGASLTASHVLWARICPGDLGGCQSHNTLLYRYGLHDHHIQQAHQQDLLVAFAAEDDNHAVEISAFTGEDSNCIDSQQEPNPPPCELTRVGPIPFESTPH